MESYKKNYGIEFERVTTAVMVIMVAMGGAFIVRAVLHAFGVNILPWFALSGVQVGQGMWWQFVTYMFLHHNFFHLGVNMLGLFFFGPHVEKSMGPRQFCILFFLGGALGGLGWLLMSDPHMVCVGASGAVYGVLGAFAALNFHMPVRLLLFLVVPITTKGWVLALVFALVELIMLVSSPHGGIAYAAHLGGLVVGFIYAGTWQNRDRMPDRPRVGMWRRPKLKVLSEKTPVVEKQNVKLDQILDKIAAEGMESLTAAEKRRLEKASREIRTKGR